MKWIRICESAQDVNSKQKLLDTIEECGKVCCNLARAGLINAEILEKTEERRDEIADELYKLGIYDDEIVDMIETFFGMCIRLEGFCN